MPGKKKLHIIKIGGNVIDDVQSLSNFVQGFADINEAKILVHGGGKSATQLAGKLGIGQTMVNGRRITDAATLDVTIMVYAGLINKTIVSKLQSYQCNAMGFCGADGNMIKSRKRQHAEIDFGYVGDILSDGINTSLIDQCLKLDITPVFSAITHDNKGNLLNTNADHIASAVAIGMSAYYDVSLTYCFEKKGVLTDSMNEDSYLRTINQIAYTELCSSGHISGGMIPKLDNAFHALEKGVSSVNICGASNISTHYFYTEGTVLNL